MNRFLKTNGEFVATMQKKVATSAMGPSSLRNQGEGILKKAQVYCSKIDLNKYKGISKDEFLYLLDKDTSRLLMKFENNSWGAARKALNLFFRDSLYNRYLSEVYSLESIEPFLEIPLDSAVAKGLNKRAFKKILPRWTGLKYLTKTSSDEYQSFAQQESEKMKMSRVHLDMYLWLENR